MRYNFNESLNLTRPKWHRVHRSECRQVLGFFYSTLISNFVALQSSILSQVPERCISLYDSKKGFLAVLIGVKQAQLTQNGLIMLFSSIKNNRKPIIFFDQYSQLFYSRPYLFHGNILWKAGKSFPFVLSRHDSLLACLLIGNNETLSALVGWTGPGW